MKYLVTGGAGFIGVNASERYLRRGDEVVILDNFSRHASLDANIQSLAALSERLTVVPGDVRDDQLLTQLFAEHTFDVVLHLAAQVAVTTSVANPRLDFETNALGTFNLLEAVRESKQDPVILYASTNKVYGGMEDVAIVERGNRYDFADLPEGVSETRPLDFHSPYGCSKGAGDQYMVDYARIFGLRTVTFRQSCIYGYRQFGVEDQGWVAWFTIASQLGKPITIFGDGKQVRDVLFVDDLLELYDRAIDRIEQCRGGVFNAGGGPDNRMSLLELIGFLEGLNDRSLGYEEAAWRPGDQRVFYCDITKARRVLDWEPTIKPVQGVNRLHTWVEQNPQLFADAQPAAAVGGTVTA